MSDANVPADLDDDHPDYVRMAILAAVLLVLIGVLFYSWRKPFYATLPGIDMSAITAQQSDEILKRANGQKCDCGMATCAYNVAECRHMDPGCDVSLTRAAEIVLAVTGKPAKLDGTGPPIPGASPAASPASQKTTKPAASPAASPGPHNH